MPKKDIYELVLKKNGELVDSIQTDRISIEHCCEPEEIPGDGYARKFRAGPKIITTITIRRPNPEYEPDVTNCEPVAPRLRLLPVKFVECHECKGTGQYQPLVGASEACACCHGEGRVFAKSFGE